MKPRLLNLLVCPACGQKLRSESGTWLSGELAEGALQCDCGRAYAVSSFIPRLVPEEPGRKQSRTRRSFGYQWLRHLSTDEAEDRAVFFERTGVTPEFLKGKLVLDAGCGMGRYLNVCRQHECEVVGMDLSEAVNRARETAQGAPNVHFVQGNLMQPPFAPATFDFIYSMGVLHHTPDARAAHASLARLLKPGGTLAVWVYVRHAAWKEAINSSLRAVTTRLPVPLLYRLCYLGVPLGWVKLKCAERPELQWLNRLTPFVAARPRWQDRLTDTFDWYSAPYQSHHTVEEVTEWFKQTGFGDIRVLPFPVSVSGVKREA
ncbi:MAG: methyltransferase domain-containing protein [Planctomycetes bacterium]|nr:methyltransferase domain-containing protein [Planctomycetota bacterium]